MRSSSRAAVSAAAATAASPSAAISAMRSSALTGGHPSHLVQRHRRGHRRVQRVARDLRDRAHLVACASTSARQPVALAADQQRDVALARPAQPLGRPGDERRRPAAGARRRRGSARRASRRSPPSTRARPSASTGRRSRGPSATHDAPKACAARITVPTLPGSPTPHSATASGPAGAHPALLVDADRRASPGRASRPTRAAPAATSSQPAPRAPSKPCAAST